MSDSPHFLFVIQDAQGEWYPLKFRLFDKQAYKHLAGVWQRLAGAAEKDYKLRGVVPPDWVRWKPWEWCGITKAGYEGRTAWMAWCGDHVVGFLNVWDGFVSPHEPNHTTLYIEHLAAFPGDQNTELWRRRYRHIGTALLAFAVELSSDAGYGGSVGLHSDNEKSLAFYRNVAANREIPLFQPEITGILGPTPHRQSDGGRTYLETTSDGAIRFLEEYRHE